ncbi:MAG: PilZ domain-containing protein [Methylococcales bacterium]|jgi:hypothetical protein|nr:PilZ domain-containing protein [Methylococcales bacterium]MBT7442721.1 PilZ domain-containing protein [Methylococcales bacterium]
MPERRKIPRIPYKAQVALEHPDGEFSSVQAYDLSMKGISIEQNNPADVGKRYIIKMDIPHLEVKKKIRAECIVYGLFPQQDHFRVGMRIVHLSMADTQWLRDYLDDRTRLH